MTARLRRWGILLLVVLLAGGVAGYVVYDRLLREEPAPYFESDEDHFLFGSVGTEAQDGVPYWIWLVLPRIFPEYLPGPGGYASLGMLSKPGHEIPIGFSRVTIGVPRVGINCAMCHTASVRTASNAPARLYPAAPAQQLAAQSYLRFLFAAASDPRFTADAILGEIDRNHRLSGIDRLFYRFVVIPKTRESLMAMGERYQWTAGRPDWGRGRIDPFNPAKFSYLRQPLDKTVGNSDMPALWNQQAREGKAFHWDGLNSSLQEVVLSSALGDGATSSWLDRDFARWDASGRDASSLRRVQNYITTLEPPKYPFPIDALLAARGEAVFTTECGACHARGGQRTGTVVPLTEVGTDRHRLDMWTKGAADAYNAYGRGRPWAFSRFRTSNGYVAVPLDGIWLRAPYLHNGSVPTLADLLSPMAERPTMFWRGDDIYDPVKVGFVSDGASPRRATRFETSVPGNGNGGHEFGTALPADTRRALLEYLKTL